MTLTVSIEDIVDDFPNVRVVAVRAERLRLAEERTPALDALIAEREAACRARWDGCELSEIPGIAAWRAAYKGFGIKRSSYRSAVERLVKRVKGGERLPAVNTLVDVYNTVSLSHVFCCGADDLDTIAPLLAFRFARAGDTFVDMGAEPGEDPNDPPKAGEVVYADSRHVLCRRWNWRQDARTGLSTATQRAVVTIQANGWGDLDAAAADLAQLVRLFCGGTVRMAEAHAGAPIIEL